MAARLALHLRTLSPRFQSNRAVGDVVPLPADRSFVIGRGADADLQLLGEGAHQLGGHRSFVIAFGDEAVTLQHTGHIGWAAVDGAPLRRGDRSLSMGMTIELFTTDDELVAAFHLAELANAPAEPAWPELPEVTDADPRNLQRRITVSGALVFGDGDRTVRLPVYANTRARRSDLDFSIVVDASGVVRLCGARGPVRYRGLRLRHDEPVILPAGEAADFDGIPLRVELAHVSRDERTPVVTADGEQFDRVFLISGIPVAIRKRGGAFELVADGRVLHVTYRGTLDGMNRLDGLWPMAVAGTLEARDGEVIAIDWREDHFSSRGSLHLRTRGSVAFDLARHAVTVTLADDSTLDT